MVTDALNSEEIAEIQASKGVLTQGDTPVITDTPKRRGGRKKAEEAE